MEEKKLSLDELLEKANEENQRQISDLSDFVPEYKETKSKIVLPSDSTEEDKDQNKDTSVSEEDEIIGKYSQRVKVEIDPRMSTESLRQSLAAMMEKDKELVSYYNNDGTEHRNKKYDELYALINTATDINVKRRAVAFPSKAESHFVSEESLEKPAQYRQQNLFGGDDTITFKPAADANGSQGFDEAYDNLSKKIESGEINFAEDENEDQLTLTDDTPAIKPVEDGIGEQLAKNAEEKEKRDKKDYDLMYAFQMMNDDKEAEKAFDDQLNAVIKTRKDRKKQPKEQAPEPEYTDRSQNGDIDDMLRRRVKSSRIKTVLCAVLTLFILYLELSFKGSPMHPAFLQPGRNGLLYILIDIQALCLIGIVMQDSLIKGFTSLFSRKSTAESVMSVSMAVSIAYAVVTALSDGKAITNGLVCLPAACTAFACSLIDYLTAQKDVNCFRVVASQRPKYVSEKLRNTAREGTEFYKYLLDDSELYTVKRTDFVDGFLSRINRRPEGEDLFGFLILVISVAGAALFGIQNYLGMSVYEAYTAFTKLVLFSLPVSAFFIINLPVVAANIFAKKSGSALIGRAVSEEYADASVISFADTEVYPSNKVKITSIKTYGDYRIDHIICDLARVFSFIGGPLKDVTSKMMSGGDISYRSARLIESASDGICVVIDGKEMFLGKKTYLRRYRFETPVDAKDDRFEETGGSIMYVTLDDMLVAKVYSRYNISDQFVDLLRNMYRAGMCVGVKTVDPNITDALLERTVRYKKCPISILKAGEVGDVEGHSPRIDSGIVSTSSLHTFLKMFIVCDKVRHIVRSNGFINVLSIALAFFVSFFLASTGQLSTVQSFYPVLFQLLWLLPIGVISFIL